MIQLFATINLLLGTAVLTLYLVVSQGNLLFFPKKALLLPCVAFFCLMAAAIGFKRFSIFFLSLGVSAFAALANFSEIPTDFKVSQTLQNFIVSAQRHWILLAFGFFSIILGSLLDFQKDQKKTPKKRNLSKKIPKLAQNQEKGPEKKIISCSCGKKMRVKIGVKKIRCPSCQEILLLK